MTQYALGNAELRQALRGVVCLGTPFLHVRPNPLGKNPRQYLILTFGLLLVGFLVSAALPSAAPGRAWVWFGGLVLAIPPILLAACGLWRTSEGRLALHDFRLARQDPKAYSERLAFPEVDPDRIVVVRITGDEASGVLVFSQFFVWILRTAWKPLDQASALLDRARENAWLLGLSILAAAAAAGLGLTTQASVDLVRAIAVTVMAIGLGLPGLVIGISAYLVFGAMVLMHLPFGPDAVLASPFVETTAEPSPPGSVLVQHLSPTQDASETWLHHSRIYEMEAAFEFISQWMAERI